MHSRSQLTRPPRAPTAGLAGRSEPSDHQSRTTTLHNSRRRRRHTYRLYAVAKKSGLLVVQKLFEKYDFKTR